MEKYILSKFSLVTRITLPNTTQPLQIPQTNLSLTLQVLHNMITTTRIHSRATSSTAPPMLAARTIVLESPLSSLRQQGIVPFGSVVVGSGFSVVAVTPTCFMNMA